MGILQLLLDGITGLLATVASWVSGLNPCPFKNGLSFDDGFANAFGYINAFVDIPACLAITVAWGAGMAICFIVMMVWRWLKAV